VSLIRLNGTIAQVLMGITQRSFDAPKKPAGPCGHADSDFSAGKHQAFSAGGCASDDHVNAVGNGEVGRRGWCRRLWRWYWITHKSLPGVLAWCRIKRQRVQLMLCSRGGFDLWAQREFQWCHENTDRVGSGVIFVVWQWDYVVFWAAYFLFRLNHSRKR